MFEDELYLAYAVTSGVEARGMSGRYSVDRFRFNSAKYSVTHFIFFLSVYLPYFSTFLAGDISYLITPTHLRGIELTTIVSR